MVYNFQVIKLLTKTIKCAIKFSNGRRDDKKKKNKIKNFYGKKNEDENFFAQDTGCNFITSLHWYDVE